MKIFSSKKRVAVIGALTAVTLVGGGTAFAYWTSLAPATAQHDSRNDGGVPVQFATGHAVPRHPTMGPRARASPSRSTIGDAASQHVTNVMVSVADAAGIPGRLPPNGELPTPSTSASTAAPRQHVRWTCFADRHLQDVNGGASTAPLPVTIKMLNKSGANQDDCKGATSDSTLSHS